MPQLSTLYHTYSASMNFLFIYILEAHAQDEWPISSARWSPTQLPVQYNQTRTIAERMAVAKDFARDFNVQMPIVLDNPETNLFERLYAPWPVRIYVVDKDRRVTYKAQPDAAMLELREFTEHLSAIQ